MARRPGTAFGDVLLGTGSDDQLYGFGSDDRLEGGDGSDTLDGGTGADTMIGGKGDDTYYVDSVDQVVRGLIFVRGDHVVEQAGEGNDTVYASVSYTLPDNVENLHVTGAAIAGTGNALANLIVGNDGNNILDGRGGADVMHGSSGDDTYYVDTADRWASNNGGPLILIHGDQVDELANDGTDTVMSLVTYRLPANVENLTLLWDAANPNRTFLINGYGNNLPNTIEGNQGNNLLYGYDGQDILRGGEGMDTLDGGIDADQMTGGGGNDTYYVDNLGDRVIEADGHPNDLGDQVFSSIDFTLPDAVEFLYLTGRALVGVGNDLRNIVHGNAEQNTLLGGGDNDVLNGDANNDILIGGTGDDSYTVDVTNDMVVERQDEGTNSVYSTASYYELPAYVENLSFQAGNGAWGVGNDIANFIQGENFDEFIKGRGGSDTLTGWLGRDTFVYELASDGGPAGDTITDFVHGTDRIALVGSGFGLARTGSLAASGVAFVAGPAATGAMPTVIFDAASHQVLWDRDGAGSGAAVLLATLTGVATMDQNDFYVM